MHRHVGRQRQYEREHRLVNFLRQSESFPNAVLEYMAAGKPIVVTDVGGIPEIIQHESQGVYVGNRCTLGSVNLEEDVTIGSNVDLLTGRRQHGFDDLSVPIQAQLGTFQQIRIGRNSWIGNSAVVMADVGEDCVIGASVVALSSRVIAVGNPANAVRERRVPAMRHDEGTDPCVGS